MEVGNAGSFSVAFGQTNDRIEIGIASQQFTLRDIWQQHGPFDLIKLDVEGLENALLRDDLNFVSSRKTRFWLECNESGDSLTLCQTLFDAGLEVYYCAFPVAATDNYNNAAEVIFPWAYESGLWATYGEPPKMPAKLQEAGCVIRRIRSIADLRQAMWDTPRWAPADWANKDLPTIVSHACHIVLGERFEDYLLHGIVTGPKRWADPMPLRMSRERDSLLEKVEEAQSAAHASEVMLYAEREWVATQCRRFEAQDAEMANLRDQLAAATDKNNALQTQVASSAQRLAEFETSTVYRVIQRLRSIAWRHPRLFRALRPIVRHLRRIFGRR
jgi:hypothetical protein